MRRRVPIIALIAIVVVAVGFAGLIVTQKKAEQQRVAHIEKLQAEAAPYEQEIEGIQEDLDKREKEMLSQELPTASAIVCFTINSSNDIDTVKKLTANDDFTPAIVLNCTQGTSAIRRYLWRLTYEKYDVILTADTVDADTLKTADEICERLKSYNYTKEPVFQLSAAADNETSRKLLEEHGYTKLIRSSETLESGSEGNSLYLPYKMIHADTALDTFADEAEATHAGVYVEFDTAALTDQTLTEQNVTDCLDVLNARRVAGTLEYGDSENAFKTLQESETAEQEYNSYKTEQENRIESLRQQVAEIYDQWDNYK